MRIGRLVFRKGQNITEYARAIRDALMEDGVVFLDMEPGDCTHYDLVVVSMPDGRIGWGQQRDSGGFFGVVGAEPEYIDYFMEKMGPANPHTLHMINELHSLIFGHVVGMPCATFDFTTGRMIE